MVWFGADFITIVGCHDVIACNASSHVWLSDLFVYAASNIMFSPYIK